MGYMLVTAVLVVTFGRLGDQYGRVRIYNLGFVIFTVAAIALWLDPFTGGPGAMWLIVWRFVQGVGGAMLFANSTAILTDAFPANKRGFALGLNQVAAIAGSFIGLIVGGLLADLRLDGRLLRQRADRHRRHDLVVQVAARGRHPQPGPHRLARTTPPSASASSPCSTGITYGIQPYGDSSTGWGNPWVIGVDRRRHRPARRLRLPRTARAVADVQHAAVPHPRVRQRQSSPDSSPRSAEAACSSC